MKVKVVVPSNIALIKYWGKKEYQKPINPSLSLTLKNCVTYLEVESVKGVGEHQYFFENKESHIFTDRVQKYLNNLKTELKILGEYKLSFHSKNTFPHSSGLASSASSFGAIALGLCLLEEYYFPTKKGDLYQRASKIARQGSGSACRSLYGGFVSWGKSELFKESSDEYAIHLSDLQANNFLLGDSVLIIDSTQKEVSSSVGHQLMDRHIFKESRVKLANANYKKIYKAIADSNIKDFLEIIQKEALSLHSLMMSSDPSFILLKPNTLKAIEKVKNLQQRGYSIGFTLDAGPNLHLLYPLEEKEEVRRVINEEFSALCESGTIIHDEVGTGPSFEILDE